MIRQLGQPGGCPSRDRSRPQRPQGPTGIINVNYSKCHHDMNLRSFEKQAVFRTLRAFRFRPVPLCRSTNAVLIVLLTLEWANADCNPAAAPKINRVPTPPRDPPSAS